MLLQSVSLQGGEAGSSEKSCLGCTWDSPGCGGNGPELDRPLEPGSSPSSATYR